MTRLSRPPERPRSAYSRPWHWPWPGCAHPRGRPERPRSSRLRPPWSTRSSERRTRPTTFPAPTCPSAWCSGARTRRRGPRWRIRVQRLVHHRLQPHPHRRARLRRGRRHTRAAHGRHREHRSDGRVLARQRVGVRRFVQGRAQQPGDHRTDHHDTQRDGALHLPLDRPGQPDLQTHGQSERRQRNAVHQSLEHRGERSGHQRSLLRCGEHVHRVLRHGLRPAVRLAGQLGRQDAGRQAA